VVHPATGQPAKPGEVGELVLTTLGRLGSPLLRYRTGDLVQPLEHAPCECGSYELSLQGGLLGRTDDVVIVRGVNVYPSALEDVVRASPGIVEYRVEVETRTTLPEIRVKVEISPEHTDTAGLVKRLETALRTTFALRIPVSHVPAGSLPRFEMKSKRWARV